MDFPEHVNYVTLDRLLTRNDKPVRSRKIANNTYAIRREHSIVIRYHDTDIVTYTNRGLIALDTGGWLTLSTKERINRFTPTAIQVFSQSGRWFVTTRMRTDGVQAPDFECNVPFTDGIVFDPFASISGYRTHNHLEAPEVARENAHNKAVEKLLDRYLRHLTLEQHRIIVAGNGKYTRKTGKFDDDGEAVYEMVYPHEGCAMCVRTAVGTLVGDQFEDVQHLIEHLQDLVYPYTLMWVACDQRDGGTRGRIQIWDLTKRDLREYLRQQLYVGSVALKHGKRPRHTRAWHLERNTAA